MGGGDEDGKQRRNLVLASALVCVLAFLGVDLSSALALLPKDGSPIDVWRVRVVEMVVLVYLIWRYATRDGNMATQDLKRIPLEMKQLRRSYFQDCYLSSLKRFLSRPAVMGDLPDFVVSDPNSMLFHSRALATDNVMLDMRAAEIQYETADQLAVQVNCFQYDLATLKGDAAPIGPLLCKPPLRRGSWSARIYSGVWFFRVLLFSRTTINELFPYYLAFAALTVLALDLASIFSGPVPLGTL